MPLDQALQISGASAEASAWLQANTLVGLLGNSLQNLSTKATLDFMKQYDTSTAFYALRGGNDQFSLALADKLKEELLLEHRVKIVQQLKTHCLIKGTNFSLTAKKVLFAIPLPALNAIEIEPCLSLAKRQLMQHIIYTKCARLSIVAPAEVLGSTPRGGVFLFSDRFGWFREQSLFQANPNQNCVISVSVVGERAEQAEKNMLAWEHAIHAALANLSPRWDSKQATCWSDLWQEGYASFAPGIYEQSACLRACEGNFHFAGEHTSLQFASMNGALISGLRAAQEVYSGLNSSKEDEG
jgi:monoamine oxidase